jgi:hypothetical protein
MNGIEFNSIDRFRQFKKEIRLQFRHYRSPGRAINIGACGFIVGGKGLRLKKCSQCLGPRWDVSGWASRTKRRQQS